MISVYFLAHYISSTVSHVVDIFSFGVPAEMRLKRIDLTTSKVTEVSGLTGIAVSGFSYIGNFLHVVSQDPEVSVKCLYIYFFYLFAH